jgi:hypothetical protein
MNLECASKRAYSARGRRSAARLYNDIEYELALGDPGPRLEAAGEQALGHLEEGFPGVREAARQIEEPPSLSRRAGDALHGVRRRTPQRRPTARQRKGEEEAALPRWSWNRLYADMHAHPVCAVVMLAFFIIVIVNVWAYMVPVAIALAALKAYGRR